MNVKDAILKTIRENSQAVLVESGIIYVLDHDGTVYDMTIPQIYKCLNDEQKERFIAQSKIGC